MQVVALLFLIVSFTCETWRVVCKYCELFVLTDPFQDKVETLITCYGELGVTCIKLSKQRVPRKLDVSIHVMSFERLQDIHIEVLRGQQAWLVEKCLCHEVPSEEELLDIAVRATSALEEHDDCENELHALLCNMNEEHSLSEEQRHLRHAAEQGFRLTEAVMDVGEDEIKSERHGGVDEEFPPRANPASLASSGAQSAPRHRGGSGLQLQLLHEELMCTLQIIFRIFPSGQTKLQAIIARGRNGITAEERHTGGASGAKPSAGSMGETSTGNISREHTDFI